MVIFYKKWIKYNEIQLTKNKMDLNIRKITNQPPSPVITVINLSQLSRVEILAIAASNDSSMLH